ncbi:MAG TPA: DUF2442 domain-containing protein [bacterium]|nr:DUF2442 domain-containing protein [bacterium]
MLKIIQVEPLPDYRLRLRYADGVDGIVDLSHLVGKGVFNLWNDQGAFEQVSVGTGSEVRWSDDVDLCADALYMEITGKKPEEVFPSLGKTPVHACAEVSPISEPRNHEPSWKQPGLRLAIKGAELSKAIIEERRDESIL